MYHSDLRQEIRFLQAQAVYKRKKLSEAITSQKPFEEIRELGKQIQEIEQRLQFCWVESNAQEAAQNDQDTISRPGN